MVYTAFILLVTITIPLWVGSFCMSGAEAKKSKDLGDCAHMIANATGCFPRPGSGSTSRPDGTIKLETEVIRECLPSAELGVSCAAADCCVMNPALVHYRDTEEVRSLTLWPCPLACRAHPASLIPLRPCARRWHAKSTWTSASPSHSFRRPSSQFTSRGC